MYFELFCLWFGVVLSKLPDLIIFQVLRGLMLGHFLDIPKVCSLAPVCLAITQRLLRFLLLVMMQRLLTAEEHELGAS